MCALQLHNAENIDESDVELHRRLINQVTGIFYGLSTYNVKNLYFITLIFIILICI